MRQVRWSGIRISWRIFQFVVIGTIKGFGVVNKAEIDAFLELSCFFYDLADVGNLISVSSAFSKSSLNIWKFMVHVLLKPGLENFEHYFECNWWVRWVQLCGSLSVLWHCLSSLVAQTVKRLSTMRETQVWSLGWEDPLEKEMATHSRILSWKVPCTEEPCKKSDRTEDTYNSCF